MKKTFSALILLYTVFIFTSCEKEVTLDLESTTTQYVIQGVISNDSDVQTVKISKSVNFYDPNLYPAVSGAIVRVSENGNAPVIFNETSPGVYQASNLAGVPGNTYSLSVIIQSEEYTAVSTMPLVVPFTELTYKENTSAHAGSEASYEVTPVFTDPASTVNFYRFNLLINDIADKGFFTQNDDLINGEINSFGIRSTDDDNEITTGSKITVEMLCIDSNIYDYFYVLNKNTSGQNTPNNPKSNISGKMLGYFSAQNKQVKTVTIP
jgi:hypothetical protein